MTSRALLCLLALAPLSTRAADWTVDTGSTLSFEGSYQGEAFTGAFKRFDAKIAFDAADPAKTSFDVSIDMTSADTQNAERDSTLGTSDFFWTEKFKTARFVTESCAADAAKGGYVCEAKLTIRDKTVALKFPFTWSAEGAGAKLVANVSLDRTAFDVGGGDWADETVIGHAVTVKVALTLKPKA